MATTLKTNRPSPNPLAKFWRKNSQNILPPIVGILGFLIVWQLCSMTGLIKLPPPTDLITNERTRIYLMYPFLLNIINISFMFHLCLFVSNSFFFLIKSFLGLICSN